MSSPVATPLGTTAGAPRGKRSRHERVPLQTRARGMLKSCRYINEELPSSPPSREHPAAPPAPTPNTTTICLRTCPDVFAPGDVIVGLSALHQPRPEAKAGKKMLEQKLDARHHDGGWRRGDERLGRIVPRKVRRVLGTQYGMPTTIIIQPNESPTPPLPQRTRKRALSK